MNGHSHDFSSPAPTSSSFPNENPNAGFVEDIALPLSAPTSPDCINQNSMGERGLSPPPPPEEADQPSEPTLALDSGELALQRLIGGSIPQGERASLVEAIFSSRKVADMVARLHESDAQTFIDVVDEVRHHPSNLEETG